MTKIMFKYHCWYSRQNPGLQVFLIFVIASPLQLVIVQMMLIHFADLVSPVLMMITLPLIACTGIITVSKMNYLIYRLQLKMNKKEK